MSNEFFAGGLKQSLQNVLLLGVSTVTTADHSLGVVRRRSILRGFRIHGVAQVTATTLTAQLFKRTAGGAQVALSDAVDIDFASAAAALAGVEGVVVGADAALAADDLLEVAITAASATAGPGDLVVSAEYEVTH